MLLKHHNFFRIKDDMAVSFYFVTVFKLWRDFGGRENGESYYIGAPEKFSSLQ